MEPERRLRCRKCNRVKREGLFIVDKGSRTGRTARCKRCTFRFRYGDRLDVLALARKQAGLCGICDRPVAWGDHAFDHIAQDHPGWRTNPANLHLVHQYCNVFKRDRSLAYAREHIHARLAAREAVVAR